MQYFSYLPNVQIAHRVNRLDRRLQQISVKNLFRRVRAREDLLRYTQVFEAYEIEDGELPWQIAYRAYGDEDLDWVILLTNEIYDVWRDWPLSRAQLQRMVEEKYALSGATDGVHHYESIEIVDEVSGNVIVPAGVWVNDDWIVTANNRTYTFAGSREPISNYEHEYYLNELKRQIFLPRSELIEQFKREFDDLVSYDEDQYTDSSKEKTNPIDIIDYFVGALQSKSGSFSARHKDDIAAYTGRNAAGAGTTVVSYTGASTTAATTAVSESSSTTTTTTTTSTTSTSSSSSSSSSSGSSGYGY